MQLPPKSYSPAFSGFLRSYYLAPNHPCKLRLLRWLEAMAGKKRILVKTASGFRFAVDRQDYIQNTVCQTLRWENEIGKVLSAELKASDVFYDIGANVGYFSLFALQLGCRKVVSFEPNPDLRAVFLYNLELNHYTEEKCRLVHSALAGHVGDFIYQEGPLSNSGIGHLVAGSDAPGIKVRTETLDHFLENTGLPPPTVIKLDVEGWEIDILRGAEKLFEKSPPRLVIFEADCKADCEIADKELSRFFTAHGYATEHLRRKEIEAKENYVARRI
jgi:FkbM family methyltransferase